MNDFFSIKELVCGYHQKFHLKSVSFSVARGMLVGIIGPNGCGKTTLFRGITGELTKKAGHVLLNGQDLSGLTLKERACKLAIVSQISDAPEMTVEEYLLMGRIPHHSRYQFFDTTEDYRIVHQYAELTGVFSFMDKQISQLSGGELQLVSITRALVQEPELLLLDEPTSHLDIAHQVQILNLVQQLNENLGLTVLMIVHDLNLASEYCNQLVLMKKGEIVQTGTPEQVLTYENIEKVYDTAVVTQTNPISGNPAVFLVSQKLINRMNKK